MSEATIKWLMEGAPWLKYAVETQLMVLKSDVSLVLRTQSISSIISRLKDHQVGIPALNSGKVGYRSTGNAFWDLYFLADIGLSAKNMSIDNEVEEFLK